MGRSVHVLFLCMAKGARSILAEAIRAPHLPFSIFALRIAGPDGPDRPRPGDRRLSPDTIEEQAS